MRYYKSVVSGEVFSLPKTIDEGPPNGCVAVVVVSPEDREQVERLSKAMHESDHIAPWHDLHSETRAQIEDAMQDALRSLIAPEKPAEPMGLAALVEDDEGRRWIRASSGAWTNLDARGGYLNWSTWDQFAAVKVLSEGVIA